MALEFPEGLTVEETFSVSYRDSKGWHVGAVGGVSRLEADETMSLLKPVEEVKDAVLIRWVPVPVRIEYKRIGADDE